MAKKDAVFCDEVKRQLFARQDLAYKEFQSGLIPTVDKDSIIGVRTPALRALARELEHEAAVEDFLTDLPHQYFDENQLHAFLLSREKDYQRCLLRVNAFLPYVDNWATCDQMSPKVFKKHREELSASIAEWLHSSETYTVRFGIGMLMEHYLDEDFRDVYLQQVAEIHSGAYYINMMAAWYFATALAKQWDAAIIYLQENRLDIWTHNKTIQKAVESRRITEEQKEYLRGLRRKGK